MRPNAEVITAEPEDLDAHVLRLTPDVVICSESTDVVRERVPFWIELYPEYGPRSVVGEEGKCTTIEEIQLSDLLSVLDRAERLAQQD